MKFEMICLGKENGYADYKCFYGSEADGTYVEFYLTIDWTMLTGELSPKEAYYADALIKAFAEAMRA